MLVWTALLEPDARLGFVFQVFLPHGGSQQRGRAPQLLSKWLVPRKSSLHAPCPKATNDDVACPEVVRRDKTKNRICQLHHPPDTGGQMRHCNANSNASGSRTRPQQPSAPGSTEPPIATQQALALFKPP